MHMQPPYSAQSLQSETISNTQHPQNPIVLRALKVRCIMNYMTKVFNKTDPWELKQKPHNDQQ